MTRVGLLVAAFALSLGLRVVLGEPDVARSVPAALVFAACLLAVAVAAGTRVPVSLRAVAIGVAGIALVCAPVAIERLFTLRPLHDADGFLPWAAAVTVVATAEEVFLRGTVYDALEPRSGVVVAVVVGAVLFALLHVPLYGWHVVPLDLAVGLVLGGLRHGSGTPAAPAVTHVGADLVGWFVR